MRKLGVYIILILLLVFVLGLSYVFLDNYYINEHQQSFHHENNEHLAMVSSVLDKEFTTMEEDARLIRQLLNNAAAEDLLIDFAKELFQELLETKRDMIQVRILTPEGREVLRYDRLGQRILQTSPQDLQDKSDRYYYYESRGQKEQDIYFSKIDLNIENGRIDVPYNPVIRTVINIYNGEVLEGYLVINYSMKDIFGEIKNTAHDDDRSMYILNQEGYWLLHEEKSMEWGFMFEGQSDKTLREIHPSRFKRISQEGKGSYKGESLGTFITYQMPGYNQRALYIYMEQHGEVTLGLYAQRRMILAYIGTSLFIVLFLLFMVIKGVLSRRKEKTDQLTYQALHDQLTDLPNRTYLLQELNSLEASSHMIRSGLLMLDLDGFKEINDQYGHSFGDEVLKVVGLRLSREVRERDMVFRLGGDEYMILLKDINERENLVQICQKIVAKVAQPIYIGKQTCQVGCSLGAVVFPDDGLNTDDLLHQADVLMYKVKKTGKNNYAIKEAEDEKENDFY